MFVDELKRAFFRLAQKESNNLLALTRKTGVNNSTLNRLNSHKANFENLPAKTIERLFPRMVVYFFPEDAPRNEGNVSGAIAAGKKTRAVVSIDNLGRIYNNNDRLVCLDELENKLLHAEDLTAEERVKFLLFLKERVR